MAELSVPKLTPIVDIKVDKPAINTAVNNRVANTPETQTPMRFANPDMFSSESVQKNIPQMTAPSKNTLNKLPTFIDISDKLAAIYGEKEKDIKDKLSDTFKKLILRPFNLISEVDTSMNQNEHHKERKIKDKEPENKNNEIVAAKKDFSLSKWINYKLLEITGEILNISRKFSAGIKEKHNNIKKKFYNGFKKIKGKIVFSLDKIESLFESDTKK
ncbi:MAG TPA: hypothetical protein DDW90_06670 [Cyanobacteria bacterium UBA9971]|nr:hypothetical protein [Cyanobacteria bacterium UBA9971]